LWRVDSEPRQGHASDTYRVVRDPGGERAALTVFDTPALQLGSYPRRIFEISRLLETVDHPGVINVLNVGVLADGRVYVVADVDAGATLAEIVPEGTCVDVLPAITILRGVCAPLIAAHDIGVVHEALDLENVFLLEDDERYIKLLDWGIERAVFDEARRAGFELPARVTCVAPEEALGLRSPQTDSYALGVLAYRLLLGCAPFEADSPEALRAMQLEVRPDPRTLCPTLPAALEALLCELLAPDPRSRPSIRNASERLAAMARDELAPPEIAEVVPPSARITQPTDVTTPVYRAYSEPDDEVIVAPSRGRVLGWTIGAAACCAILVAVTVSAVRTSSSTARHSRSHTAISWAASTASPIEHPAAIEVARAVKLGPTFTRVPKRTISVAASRPVTVEQPQPAALAAPPTTPIAETAPATPRTVERAPQPPRAPVRVAARSVRPAPPARVRAPSRALADVELDARNALLADYQRLGRALLKLQQERGEAATSELWQQFHALKIQPAVATARSRAVIQATLRELREKIERQQRLEISDACRNNPLADGCR
jgi:serine/threonine protein kinase